MLASTPPSSPLPPPLLHLRRRLRRPPVLSSSPGSGQLVSDHFCAVKLLSFSVSRSRFRGRTPDPPADLRDFGRGVRFSSREPKRGISSLSLKGLLFGGYP